MRKEFIKLPNPVTRPTGTANGCAFTADGSYLAVGHFILPYITIYKRNEDSFEKLSDPAILPLNAGRICAFTSDGSYLAVPFFGVSPYLIIYKRNGDIFTKLPDPEESPGGDGYSCAFTADGSYLAVAHFGYPCISIYKRNGDVFTKLPNPANPPASIGFDCAFTEDGSYLAIVHQYSPFLTIYRRDGDNFIKLPNPTDIPTQLGRGCSFTEDGSYLAVTYSNSINIYERDGDTFVRSAYISNLPGTANQCAFSKDGTYLAVGYSNSPYITIYKRTGDTFTKLPDPEELPTGNAHSCSFTQDSMYLAVGHSLTPNVTIYKRRLPIVTNSITFYGGSVANFGRPVKQAASSIAFRGHASMSLSAAKTAGGKITFRGGSFMSLIGLVLRELEEIYQISSSEIISRNQPVLSTDLANYIEVWINPRVPADETEEVYRSKEPETIAPDESKTFSLKFNKDPVIEAVASLEDAGSNLAITETEFYSGSAEITVKNSGATEQTCIIVVQARPLELQGRRKIVVKDEESILDHGLVKYTFDSPLVQDEESAYDIGQKILWLFSVARANIEIEWRGDPALELADIVQIPEFEKLGVSKKENFYVVRQLLEIVEGGLDATLSGRKIPRLKEGD